MVALKQITVLRPRRILPVLKSPAAQAAAAPVGEEARDGAAGLAGAADQVGEEAQAGAVGQDGAAQVGQLPKWKLTKLIRARWKFL